MVTIYNSFPQIHLHNTNAFFEDLTGKDFYNLADKLFTYILIFQCRIRISQLAKYYKVIFENCKACRGAPTMVQFDFWRFWNVYSPKTSKAVFWDVPCINKKAIGVSKYHPMVEVCTDMPQKKLYRASGGASIIQFELLPVFQHWSINIALLWQRFPLIYHGKKYTGYIALTGEA